MGFFLFFFRFSGEPHAFWRPLGVFTEKGCSSWKTTDTIWRLFMSEREGGQRERERETGPEQDHRDYKWKNKKKNDTLERREKTGGGCCVAYDNLKLFDGINKKKKKNLMQESSLGPATDYSRRFACGSYYIIHSPWWDFPPLLVFSLLPPSISRTLSQHWQVSLLI